jgi:hypothetical protein
MPPSLPQHNSPLLRCANEKHFVGSFLRPNPSN